MTEGVICRTCGGLMVRTGTCYTCPSCGDSTGCGREETAADIYYNALDQQRLPAAVPIDTPAAAGLGAAQFDVLGNENARGVALSPDWRRRAIACVYACRAAHEAVERDMAHF